MTLSTWEIQSLQAYRENYCQTCLQERSLVEQTLLKPCTLAFAHCSTYPLVLQRLSVLFTTVNNHCCQNWLSKAFQVILLPPRAMSTLTLKHLQLRGSRVWMTRGYSLIADHLVLTHRTTWLVVPQNLLSIMYPDIWLADIMYHT